MKKQTVIFWWEFFIEPYTKEYEGEYSEIEVTDASGLVVRYYAK